MEVDLRGMVAEYDAKSKTFTLRGIRARDAHVLIWGGFEGEFGPVETALRHALVAAEDDQMSDEDYHAANG